MLFRFYFVNFFILLEGISFFWTSFGFCEFMQKDNAKAFPILKLDDNFKTTYNFCYIILVQVLISSIVASRRFMDHFRHLWGLSEMSCGMRRLFLIVKPRQIVQLLEHDPQAPDSGCIPWRDWSDSSLRPMWPNSLPTRTIHKNFILHWIQSAISCVSMY